MTYDQRMNLGISVLSIAILCLTALLGHLTNDYFGAFVKLGLTVVIGTLGLMAFGLWLDRPSKVLRVPSKRIVKR